MGGTLIPGCGFSTVGSSAVCVPAPEPGNRVRTHVRHGSNYGLPAPRDRAHSPTRRDPASRTSGGVAVTLIWFVVWLIANYTGGHEPLLTDPVNVWTWTLILAVALDLAGAHASQARRRG